MFSYPPGRVADRYGEQACAIIGAVISAVAYLVLSFGWGGYYSVPAFALYGLAFLVGHGACWLKVAVLSTAVHALGLGLETGSAGELPEDVFGLHAAVSLLET